MTLDEANQVVRTGVEAARARNLRICIAVCDAGGRLVAFNRMDGATFGAVYGSQGKAIASAAFGRPSGEVQERAATPIVEGIRRAEGEHLIPSRGAVPIVRDGVLEGACGVGGATPEEDEEIARAAVAAVRSIARAYVRERRTSDIAPGSRPKGRSPRTLAGAPRRPLRR